MAKIMLIKKTTRSVHLRPAIKQTVKNKTDRNEQKKNIVIYITYNRHIVANLHLNTPREENNLGKVLIKI